MRVLQLISLFNFLNVKKKFSLLSVEKECYRKRKLVRRNFIPLALVVVQRLLNHPIAVAKKG